MSSYVPLQPSVAHMVLRYKLKATIARAKRKRYLLEKRRILLKKSTSCYVPHYTQRTYVAINGDAYTCMHGGLWETTNPFVVRSPYRIEQLKTRLRRRTYLLRKKHLLLQTGPCLPNGDQPSTSTCLQSTPPRISNMTAVPIHSKIDTCSTDTSTDLIKENSLTGPSESVQRKIFQPWNFGAPKCICPYCSSIVWYEERNKKTRSTKNPHFSICCQNGKVELPSYKCPPNYLKELLDYKGGSRSKRFRKHIRTYNSIFASTSMGGRVDNAINTGKGPYVFRLNGQNHHRIGSLLPVEDMPKFAQLYIYDTENETQNRMRSCGLENENKLDPEIVDKLKQMFDQINPLAKVFRTARDRFLETDLHNVSLRLLGKRKRDGRQYNLPTTSEVAAIIVGNDYGINVDRDVIVEEKSRLLQRINENHPTFMAMQYPILFPYAEDGYRPNIEYKRLENRRQLHRCCITKREYYAYRIQNRLNEGITVLAGGRLFHQHIVDAYTTIEEERLNWIRRNQSNIRSDLYKGLQDAVSVGDISAKCIGKRTILPSSFTGGPRYMIQSYHDALAICRWCGPPDLFITFTCNSKWPEIKEMTNLIPGQPPEDRPDIVARVFHIKLNQLMADIRDKGHFGRVKAALYTIEFQKRGLLHAHILLFLHNDDKPKTAVDVDKIITAEIPDSKMDPPAYNALSQFMVHGPCGVAFPNSPCMIDGHCSKHYPKKFRADTSFDDDGFPMYRRRNTGRFVTSTNGVKFDNTWIVPHNPDLIVKYQAHINIEVCNKTRSVKYLFKYINKGHDQATVVIVENNGNYQRDETAKDEIKSYLDCRYVSASEACWRVFEFEVQYHNPAVERLLFHLPGEHTVIFHDNDTITELMARPNIEKTMFTEWMNTNKLHEDARKLTYIDFPTRWVWIQKEKIWQRRKRGQKIGRLYYAHPTSGERFYLRLLLTIVKGPTSYEAIRTVDNICYENYKSACAALGLLEDDNEWNEALREASCWASSASLRELFVTLLLYCELADPLQLWKNHWDVLSDDILWRQKHQCNENLHISVEKRQNLCLVEIEKILKRNNRTLNEFPSLPQPDFSIVASWDNHLIQEELNYDHFILQDEANTMIAQLNIEQKSIFDMVIDDVKDEKGGFYFVYGSGGTGKTYLWNTIITAVRALGKIVLAVATSGIASLLLPGGRTAHSRFKIPIDALEESTCNIAKQSNLAQLIKNTHLIIWDEAPMVHRHSFEAFERTLRDLSSNTDSYEDEKLFGGKTILLGGDFKQILPVVRKGTRSMIVDSSISQSYLWKHCTILKLTINMRLKIATESIDEVTKQAEFSKWVLDVGDGKIPAIAIDNNDEATWIKIPKEYLIPDSLDALQKIINNTYADLQQRLTEKNYLRDRCILAPTNDSIDEINSYILSNLHGDMVDYFSADSISPVSEMLHNQHILFPIEFLNSLQAPGIPNHKLQLKIGVPIMLIRNLNPTIGLCNGTRLIITHLTPKVIQAEIMTGTSIGNKVLLPRIVFTSSTTDTKWPFTLKRRQFPVKVCFAMTINKSQGQTLENVGIYLPRPVFSHGQLYVALSRTTSYKGLKIYIKNHFGQNEYTENIVYTEIFDNLLSTLMEVSNILLTQVNLTTRNSTIRARVARKWESINANNNEPFQLNFQLLDEQEGQMRAVIQKKHMELYAKLVVVGHIYDIHCFSVSLAPEKYRAVPGQFLIDIIEGTKFTEVLQSDSKIPFHKFAFLPYEQLPSRKGDICTLTDIYGILTQISDKKERIKQNGSKCWIRELHIQLECGNSITATLWGAKSDLISPTEIMHPNQPTTIVLTSTTVQLHYDVIKLSSTSGTTIYLNLRIPETENLLISNHITSAAMNIDIVSEATLSEVIAALKTNSSVGVRYCFHATIINVDTVFGWKYLSCTKCKGVATVFGDKFRCKKCMSDLDSPIDRYKLHLDVADGAFGLKVVAFDKEAQHLLDISVSELTELESTDEGTTKIKQIFNNLIGQKCTYYIKPKLVDIEKGGNSIAAYKIVKNHTITDVSRKRKFPTAEENKDNEDAFDVSSVEEKCKNGK